MYKIESFLSARLFLVPEKIGVKIFFISNLSGRLSLYVMDKNGSVPIPLLPPEIAVQNPHLVGNIYKVFPDLGQILIMLDKDGNEDYKPMFIPIDGGYPQPAFTELYEDHRFFLSKAYPDENVAFFRAASHKEPLNTTLKVDFKSGEITRLYKSVYGAEFETVSSDWSKIILNEGYTVGDQALFIWEDGESKLLFGTPMDQREPGVEYPLNSIYNCQFVNNDKGLLFFTALFNDTGGLGYLDLESPNEIKPVPINGEKHAGLGEFVGLEHKIGDQYFANFNIDGEDWVYEGTFDVNGMKLNP